MKKINIFLIALIFLALGFNSCDNDWEEPNSFSSEMWFSSGFLNKADSSYTLSDSAAICFWSLSQKCISHSWRVSDSVKFLKGNPNVDENTYFEPFVLDVLPEDYVVNADKSVTTKDKKITLYFPKIGDYTLNIHDEFADSVFYKSSIGNIGSVKDSVTGNYVFDYTFKIHVTIPESEEVVE